MRHEVKERSGTPRQIRAFNFKIDGKPKILIAKIENICYNSSMASKSQITLDILTEIMEERGFLIQPWNGCFMVISADELMSKKDLYRCWMWAFVNKSKKMYEVRFETYEALRQALYEADELCLGAYPYDVVYNPWYHKTDEEILIMRTLKGK